MRRAIEKGKGTRGCPCHFVRRKGVMSCKWMFSIVSLAKWLVCSSLLSGYKEGNRGPLEEREREGGGGGIHARRFFIIIAH